MNDSGFLVARVRSIAADESMAWLMTDGPPFEPADPLDFLNSDANDVFELYKSTYLRIDSRLNVGMPEALLEYNRWVLVIDDDKNLLAFACYKTTESGLKLGLVAAAEDPAGKTVVKVILRQSLNVAGAYAEVSEGVERVVVGHVPEVPVAEVERVLHKSVEPDEDGRHYEREITNVGRKRKLLVGLPLRP